ncbi:MAG TPA: MgtC/SapB family protein [Thermoanaerobaculia bacterium]|nr:MgtC/SapB family protein [Thermoanaerobaculia bacterium]
MSDPAVVVIRVALALVFGALIGIDRERRQKTAGMKTMTLVSIGAAGFAIMTNTFGPSNHNPAQLAAAVVGGIGFIGAGVILRRGEMVEGVTTAATLWAASSVGVASGLGYYTIATVLTVAILLVQIVFPLFEKLIRPARRSAAPEVENP